MEVWLEVIFVLFEREEQARANSFFIISGDYSSAIIFYVAIACLLKQQGTIWFLFCGLVALVEDEIILELPIAGYLDMKVFK